MVMKQFAVLASRCGGAGAAVTAGGRRRQVQQRRPQSPRKSCVAAVQAPCQSDISDFRSLLLNLRLPPPPRLLARRAASSHGVGGATTPSEVLHFFSSPFLSPAAFSVKGGKAKGLANGDSDEGKIQRPEDHRTNIHSAKGA